MFLYGDSIKSKSLIVTLISASLIGAFAKEARGQNVSDDQVLQSVDDLSDTISETAQHLWTLAEVSLRETKSAAYLKDILQQNDFKITSEGTANVPTAFIAEYGSGKPVLGIMLEYDALPGLGNAPVPSKTPRTDGVTSGHGCGHNLIGAGSLGAALALKDVIEKLGVTGTIRVYGGASEETEGAKIYMCRAGVFNDVDAMLHWHPLNVASVANIRSAAQSQMYIEFKGKASHAGLAPWKGRSALHAAELFTHGINCMREQIKPTARVHYIYQDAGVAPNVIPDKTVVRLTFREETRSDVEAGVAWIKDIAKGAALMTQTEAVAIDYFGMYELLPNTPLAERMQKHLEKVGVPQYSEEEQVFATELQKSAGVEPTGMTKNVQPLPNESTVGGSTDVGDISWLVPTMGLLMPTIPEDVTVHTWMATASHGTTIGEKGALHAAKILALTGKDILTDPAFMKVVKADFAKRTEGFSYKSPIPDFIKEPIGLPADMRKFDDPTEIKNTFFNTPGDHQFHDHDHDHTHDQN